MNLEYMENVIDDLNGQYFENGYEDFYPFELCSVGCIKIIKFANYVIWSSEEDPREYNEFDEYESLQVYLKRESVKIIKQLYETFVEDVESEEGIVVNLTMDAIQNIPTRLEEVKD